MIYINQIMLKNQKKSKPVLTISISLIIIFSFLFQQSKSVFQLDIPKNLYVFWNAELQNAPLLVQLCVEKMRMVCQQQKWSFVILTNDNLHQHISNFAEFTQVYRNAAHPSSVPPISDLVRLNVIASNGGVYMDITTILTHGLSWINKLDEVPFLITNSQIHKGVKPDCIVPYQAHYQSSAQSRDSEGRITNILPGYQAWFIAAKKNSLFIKKWRQSFQKHFVQSQEFNRKTQSIKGYFMRNLNHSDYLNVDRAAIQTIQQKQIELDQKNTMFEDRKNANKELNIIGLHGEFGPFSLYFGYTPSEDDFFTMTIYEMEEKFLSPVNFFVKLTKQHRNYFDKHFLTLKNISAKFGFDENLFDKFIASKPTSEECINVRFIVDDSVFGRLVKNNSKAKNQQIFTITIQQRNQWYDYCKSVHKVNLEYTNLTSRISSCWETFPSLIQIVKTALLIVTGQADFGSISQMLQPFYKAWSSIDFPRSKMGQLAHPSQNIYWQKRYQRLTAKMDYQSQISYYSQQKNHHQLQDSELFWMKIKLSIFRNRTQIVKFIKTWAFFAITVIVLSLIYLALKLTQWFFLVALKCKSNSLPQFLYSIQQHGIHAILRSFSRSLSNYCIWLGFSAYYALILYFYLEVFMYGRIYNQEWSMLFTIIYRKFLYYLVNRIGMNTQVLPGISFRFLCYLFTPFEFYHLGTLIFNIAHPFQKSVYSFSFEIAFCLSLIVMLIQHEYKQLKDSQQSFAQNNWVKRFGKALNHILSNLKTYIGNFLLGFLFLVATTNFRFMRNEDEYFVYQIFNTFVQPKACLLLLSVVYNLKSYCSISEAIKWTQLRQKHDELSSNKETQQMNAYGLKNKFIARKQILSSLASNSIKQIGFQILQSCVIAIKYFVRILVLLFLVNHEDIRQFLKTKTGDFDILCVSLFVSFSLQIFFETELMHSIHQAKQKNDTILEEAGTSRKNNNINHTKQYFAILSLYQIIAFGVFRLQIVLKLHQFFRLSPDGEDFKISEYLTYIILMAVTNFIGICITWNFLRWKIKTREIGKKNVHKTIFEKDEFLKVPEDDIEEIEYKQLYRQ